jgi:hypothetical protein
MALGRTHIVAPLGASDDTRKLVNRVNVGLRALDRRKPIATPSVFRDDTSRPTAEGNRGRIIFVQNADGTVTGQYSDGAVWQTFLATSVSFATPTVTYGTTYSAGTLGTTIRSDARLKFPTALMSSANDSTLTLTDDATDQTLTASLGVLNIVPGTGISINFPDSAAASLVIKPNTTTAAGTVVTVQGRPAAGTRTLIGPTWFAPASSDIFSGQPFRCWDAAFPAFLGQHTSSVFVGYDVSAMTISPSASSGADNKAYGFRATNLTIGSGNGSWAEVATAYFPGADRVLTSFKSDVLAAVIIEPPTGCNKKQDGATDVDQVGLLIRQRTAEGTAPTNRSGLDVPAQNHGTNRYAARLYNQTLVSNPSGRAETALMLQQLNTGATAGAHANLDDKAGNPPAPVTGDLWRNGNALYFRQSAATVDLTAAAAAAAGTDWPVHFAIMGA